MAFLNTRDGTIYIGVDDNGNVVGVSNVDKTMREIRDIIRDQILPLQKDYVKSVHYLKMIKLLLLLK